MTLLIGTSNGVFTADASGKTKEVEGLAGREVRSLRASNGTIYAQGDSDLAVEQSGAPKTLAITGGTGAYEGAEGVVIDELISEEPNGDQRFRDTVRFTD